MKKLLFVIDSLNIGGAEKSLISLLNNIDFQKYSVDLQLFGFGGEFERYLPTQVHVLSPLPLSLSLEKGLLGQLIHFQLRCLFARIKYSLSIRIGKLNHTDKARVYWKCFNDCIDVFPKEYDVAIAYAHNIPTFYVASKTTAKMKLAWVNAEIHFSERNISYQYVYYNKFNNIIMVSEKVYQVFLGQFSSCKEKLVIIKDILDQLLISQLSAETLNLDKDDTIPCLLTVARLERFHKGYDITLETCKILKERGFKFLWYVIGEGDYRKEMEAYIKKNMLQDRFFLLGKRSNPYPYFKRASLYVQTSRMEGFGLSLAEARMLNCPVVTTEFGAVWDQMVQGENGLVVPQEAEAVADAIMRVLSDEQLYNHIVSYQKQEKKGNTEEIQKFYQLIG